MTIYILFDHFMKSLLNRSVFILSVRNNNSLNYKYVKNIITLSFLKMAIMNISQLRIINNASNEDILVSQLSKL